jgi:hypothetical protein
MKRFFLFVLVVTGVILNSCEKEEDEFCWVLVDQLGNAYGQLCHRTEAEMSAAYPGNCNFYKMEQDFCWLLDGNQFVANRPEDFIVRFKQCLGYTTAVKVACDYCQQWYTREKHLYKPSGSFAYSQVRLQQFCGDTAQTLFQGREVILRETTDSLITVQFSNNGTF